jgi:hypothetical protein
MQVLVYGPPQGMHSEWEVAADLGDKLMSYLKRTGWQVLCCPPFYCLYCLLVISWAVFCS